MASPASPKPTLKGSLTVKVIRCIDLENKRLMGKLDPYVKLHCGGSEKFKTKTCQNGDKNPQFDQSFLFNLNEQEDQLHVKVYDDEIGTDSCIGRCDLELMAVLATGGGAATYQLCDVDNFRKQTGKIELQLTFQGTGGPAATEEKAPITGPFHFQHNATGFVVHVQGDKLVLAAGGIHDSTHAFEFQGPYIRYVLDSRYLTAVGDEVVLKAGISEQAKWKMAGVGLQHVLSSKLLHPVGDATAANTQLHLASGSSAASGFSVTACNGSATPKPAAASTAGDHAAASIAAVKVSNVASPVWVKEKQATWPASANTKVHHHPLFQVPTIYKGKYNCDVCAQPGEGVVFHCEPCGFDTHPGCAYEKRK